MKTGARRQRRFDKVLDALTSRLGFLAVVGTLVGVCLGAGIHVQTVVTKLEESHSVFRERQTRNGYVALSDTQRLILVAQEAVLVGEMTPELADRFVNAADILYVRTNHFQRIMKGEQTRLPTGAESIEYLNKIIVIADEAIANEFADLRGLLSALLTANNEARAHLVRFLDDMRRQADEVLEVKAKAVKNQQIVVISNLVGLTLFGTVALLFLRREVLARRAREEAETRVEFLAFYDPLTNLPNRAHFQERLNDLLNSGQPAALAFADLDDFKLINDTHGHAAGDAVLCHVGRILQSAAEAKGGFAARLAGDEFALVMPADDLRELSAMCEDVINAVSEPYWFEGQSFIVGVSLGLATTGQLKSTGEFTVDMLSRVADFALYASKSAGRKAFTVYDHVIEQRFRERRSMIEELPRALEGEDLEIHLQPKVALPEGDVYGFEALVRWRRNGQLVPPSEFISIAEECGLVVDIDHFVLKKAAQTIADWNARHGTEYSVSVNLSAQHFNSSRISGWVEQALWDAALPPRLMTLEVTETTEMRDWLKAREVIKELKAFGCKIAIDDFGTGFSSLAYLRTMKAHELKVDRSLVIELETSRKAQLLLASVVEIARNFELEVTVEGIETIRQAEIVREIGAGSAQGFLFGRPLPPSEALNAAMAQVSEARSA